MIMADVLMWALLISASYIVIVGYWMLSTAIFPALVARCEERLTERPVRTVIVGVFTYVPIMVLAAAVGKVPHPAVQLSALFLALATVTAALVGSAGMARRVGTGLVSARDEVEPWRRVWRGGLVLALTFLLPLVGWFLVLPLTLVSGFGALLLSRPKRAPRAVVVAEPETVPILATP